MGVHNNDKPFQCDYCEKSFKQRDKLSRHTHTVHFRERPYVSFFYNYLHYTRTNLKIEIIYPNLHFFKSLLGV